MSGLWSRIFHKSTPAGVRCSAVVPAAGSASRMGGQDKLMLPLGDAPVLVHTLRALDCCAYITEIVVVTRGDLIVPISQLCRDYAINKVRKVIVGGKTRTHSVLAGVDEVSGDAQLIAIHDGARPLVSQQVLEEVILRAAQCGAAAPGVPLKDTVKRMNGEVVASTLERDALCAVQTPQVFEPSLIKAALTRALEENAALTDDCSAVERLGIGVVITRGSYANIKITTPEDMAVCQALMEWREEH